MVVAFKSGVAIATWLSFPRFHSASGTAELLKLVHNFVEAIKLNFGR
jgi:hypothetical protein